MSLPEGRPWAGLVNQVTYGVNLTNKVDDSTVRQVATDLIAQRMFTRPVDEYYQAVMSALASPLSVTGAEGRPEDNARDFLSRLADELYRRAPWPEPAFRFVPGGWDGLGPVRPLGRVAANWQLVQQRVPGVPFTAVGDGRFGAVIRLASGATVALRGDPGDTDTVVLTDGDADAVRAEAARALGLDIRPAD